MLRVLTRVSNRQVISGLFLTFRVPFVIFAMGEAKKKRLAKLEANQKLVVEVAAAAVVAAVLRVSM